MLGRAIKEYMIENGIKQRKIAEVSGLTEQQLSDSCAGRRKVEAMEYFAICKALKVSLDYFPAAVEQMKEKQAAAV